MLTSIGSYLIDYAQANVDFFVELFEGNFWEAVGKLLILNHLTIGILLVIFEN